MARATEFDRLADVKHAVMNQAGIGLPAITLSAYVGEGVTVRYDPWPFGDPGVFTAANSCMSRSVQS